MQLRIADELMDTGDNALSLSGRWHLSRENATIEDKLLDDMDWTEGTRARSDLIGAMEGVGRI